MTSAHAHSLRVGRSIWVLSALSDLSCTHMQPNGRVNDCKLKHSLSSPCSLCCQDRLFHRQWLWVWASPTAQNWMSCFWLHQQSCWSPWCIPPWQKLCWGLSWGKWNKSTPWQALHRLSLFLAKVEPSSKHKWFSYCCIPLVSFRVWKWFFCQFCPDLTVAFGEEVLLTSSFRHSWEPCLLLTYFTSDLSPLSHQDTGSIL